MHFKLHLFAIQLVSFDNLLELYETSQNTLMKPATYTLEDFEAVFGPKALMTHSEYCYFHDTANIAIKLIEDVDTEQLQSLFESGPLHDGDTLSSRSIQRLIANQLACKVVVNRIEGYNACTQKGSWVWKFIKHITHKNDCNQ